MQVISKHFLFALFISIYPLEAFQSPQNKYKRQVDCPKANFKCVNGECIETFSVCDGSPDCSDGSDETSAICSNLNLECPSYAFRCAYGACIDNTAICDKKQDCADNSDELLPECNPTNPQVKGDDCKSGEFKCKSGECIDSFLVCDGDSNCKDGSDETISECVSMRCPSFSFQCAYGACIENRKKCNGIKDCRDGSDEGPLLCSPDSSTVRPVVTTTKRTVKPPTRQPTSKPTTPTPLPPNGGCTLPNPTDGAQYVVEGCTSNMSSPRCRSIPGTPVEPFSVLTFSCKRGYALDVPSTDKAYCISGKWEPRIHTCSKMCRALFSDSLNLECIYRGEIIPCDVPARPSTKLRPRCKPSYHTVTHTDPAYLAPTFRETECLLNGEWELPLFRCVPDCGQANRNTGSPLISFGSPTAVGEYPWHAGLYLLNEENSFTQICGGTILSPTIILSAAHCVFHENGRVARDPTTLRIVVGKYNRDWEIVDPYEQRREVERIDLYETYRGSITSYAQDIALLKLTAPIALSTLVQPACIDVRGQFDIKLGSSGVVVGWGLTENNTPSSVLLAAQLPYLGHTNCIQESPSEFLRFLTFDKFCAGNRNGTAVQSGDSGGGLTFLINGLYYVYGIVSVKPTNIDTFAAFTNVSLHLNMLVSVLNNN